MFIELTSAQVALRDELRAYFAELIPTAQREAMLTDRHGEVYRALIRRMGSDGWLGVGWPVTYGGRGFGQVEQQIFASEAARADVPLPAVTLLTVGPTLQEFGSAEEVANFAVALGKSGSYTVECGQDEYESLSSDAAGVEDLFNRLAIERLRSWIGLAAERLAGTSTRCFLGGGNDDTEEFLQQLSDLPGDNLVWSESGVHPLDDRHVVATIGYSSPTPWNTPREKTEEDIVAHFQRWIKNPAVRDLICQNWVNPEERERRMREIFGLAPKSEDSPPDGDTSDQTTVD